MAAGSRWEGNPLSSTSYGVDIYGFQSASRTVAHGPLSQPRRVIGRTICRPISSFGTKASTMRQRSWPGELYWPSLS